MGENKMKVANNTISKKGLVDSLIEFEGSSIFAEDTNNQYTVYSYGQHFPMYIYNKQENIWFGNKNRYSRTTSKHQSQCLPTNPITYWLSTDEMINLKDTGNIMDYLIKKVNDETYKTEYQT